MLGGTFFWKICCCFAILFSTKFRSTVFVACTFDVSSCQVMRRPSVVPRHLYQVELQDTLCVPTRLLPSPSMLHKSKPRAPPHTFVHLLFPSREKILRTNLSGHRYFNAANSHNDPLIDLASKCLSLVSVDVPAVASEFRLVRSIR